MTAINFTVFTDKILSGDKRQTIRKKRDNPIIAGTPLQLYTGLRTKSCKKLGDTVCTLNRDIKIYDNGTVKVDGQTLHTQSIADLANADGFSNTKDFLGFFKEKYDMPFDGVIIKWGDLVIASP